MDQLLQEALRRKASDIHLSVGIPPKFRIDGALVSAGDTPLMFEDTRRLFESIATEERRKILFEKGEVDFSYAIPQFCRYRVNAFKQRGSIAVAVRVIPEQVPSIDQLGLPETVRDFCTKNRGLVLVTGPTGSGKSTTLAAMVNEINNTRTCNILTLEDPIEYLHKHRKCIINQREVNTDTESFANGLRAALREDPDVILVGEMRDMETISIAVRAAETGHLVLATLHTGDSSQTIDRIIDVFPPHQQHQIRIQLSLTLQGIIAQQLLPRRDGSGRVVALEILVATPAIRNLIREGKTHQLLSVLQTGSKSGMQTMDAALRDLWRQGIVSEEEALTRAIDQDSFIRMTRG